MQFAIPNMDTFLLSVKLLVLTENVSVKVGLKYASGVPAVHHQCKLFYFHPFAKPCTIGVKRLGCRRFKGWCVRNLSMKNDLAKIPEELTLLPASLKLAIYFLFLFFLRWSAER